MATITARRRRDGSRSRDVMVRQNDCPAAFLEAHRSGAHASPMRPVSKRTTLFGRARVMAGLAAGLAAALSHAGIWETAGPADGGDFDWWGALATHPARAGQALLFAGFRPGEASPAPFFTSDGGATWSANARPGSFGQPLLAGTPTVAFYVSSGVARRSTDNGRSWSFVSLPLPPPNRYVQVWGVNPANANEIVASASGLVYMSSNGGASWTTDAAPAAIGSVDVDWSTRMLYASFGGSSQPLGHRPLDTPGAWGVGGQDPYVFGAGRGIVLYRTSDGSLFRSIDGGNTFTPVGQAIAPAPVCEFAFAAWPSTRVYAIECETGRLLRSVDDGATWAAVSTFTHARVGSLAIDAANPDKLFVMTRHGALVSVDGGASFAPLSRPGGAPGDTRYLFQDPTTASRQWLSRDSEADGQSVLRSLDGGATWSEVDTTHAILGASRTRANTLFGTRSVQSTARAFDVSTDGGATWSTKFQYADRSVTIGPIAYGQEAGEIYIATVAGSTSSVTRAIKYSTDDGETFVERFAPPVAIKSMVVTPSGPSRLYAGGSPLSAGAPQLYRSDNVAVTWQPVATFPASLSSFGGTTGNSITALAVDPADPDRLYAGFAYPDYLMRSDDGGATWVRATSGLGAGPITSLIVDASDASTLYVSQYGSGVFRSTDRGATWVALDDGLHDEVALGVKRDLHVAARVYAETGTGLYRGDLATGSPAGNRRAIEFYHQDFNHYFVSADLDEVAGLDAGVFKGWARTGEGFRVTEGATPGSQAVCRFFGVGFAPLSSHFYTPYPSECDVVKADPNWVYEKIAFGLMLPDPAPSRGCRAGARPLYRLWNRNLDGAPNHRYTTSRETFAAMEAQGWQFEGEIGTQVFACVPY